MRLGGILQPSENPVHASCLPSRKDSDEEEFTAPDPRLGQALRPALGGRGHAGGHLDAGQAGLKRLRSKQRGGVDSDQTLTQAQSAGAGGSPSSGDSDSRE